MRKWTPAQRANFKRTLKRRKQEKENGAEQQQGGPSDTQIAYLYGRIEGLLEAFCGSRGLSGAITAQRVGTLLRGRKGW